MATVETVTLPLSKIKENPDNPRIIKGARFDNLKKSLREFPDMLALREIVVDEDMIVLGGNMRLRALKAIGEKQAPVKIVSGLSREQKREFTIKDNAGFGEWNVEQLANEWGDCPLDEWGVDVPSQQSTDNSNGSEGKLLSTCPRCGHEF